MQYTVAKVAAEARSSRPDDRGAHRRIPERKQLNCWQAFIIASSLWPFGSEVSVDLAGGLATSRTHEGRALLSPDGLMRSRAD